jgi:hypothetical protein
MRFKEIVSAPSESHMKHIYLYIYKSIYSLFACELKEIA